MTPTLGAKPIMAHPRRQGTFASSIVTLRPYRSMQKELTGMDTKHPTKRMEEISDSSAGERRAPPQSVSCLRLGSPVAVQDQAVPKVTAPKLAANAAKTCRPYFL